MRRGAVGYAKSGDVHVAYQVVGDGPVDVIFVWGGVSHLELGWEHLPTAEFFDGLAAVSRLILIDKRGTGLSDRPAFSAGLEPRMDDLRAVLDAVGSERSFVFGESEAAGLATLFAATFPERVRGLLLYAPLVRILATDDFPWAHTAEAFDAYIEASTRHWGDGLMMSLHSPSTFEDPVLRDFWGRLERMSMSPGGFEEHMRAIADLDIRPILPLVQTPTLVLHREDDPTVPIGQGEYVADAIPGARLLRFAGSDHYPMVGDPWSLLAAATELIGDQAGTPPVDFERLLMTVLFTDIVGSTERLAAVGDRRWLELIDLHDRLARSAVARHRGRLIRTTGDGALATFDGPARAIRCALEMKEDARRLGVEIRAGLHTGEVETHGDDVAGIAVHTASRVQSEAGAGEVLVSRTVVDLVAGSGLVFDDRGVRSLRGIPGEWQLFAVA
ncbi:MAG TPA: adenylate/guanylate cyclase domain-containing protein [Acidimicrobiales bacterium]|nr:adenylate/guanylate cyclase domain-containing protein [Acidimicrobiales bacterium]